MMYLKPRIVDVRAPQPGHCWQRKYRLISSWLPIPLFLLCVSGCYDRPILAILNHCGDGVVQSDEVCDDGGESESCDIDCTAAECGDGVVNHSAGEQCDDSGESTLCDVDCTVAWCGDGRVNAAAGESCDDDGESPACNWDCTAARCGDGVVNAAAGEFCDDAGDSLSCDSDCSSAQCGDGVVNMAAGEMCDDGNLNDDDWCRASCRIATCDDGVKNGDEWATDCSGHCKPCLSDITLGRFHTCALLADGAVRCWGLANGGRLGYGSGTPRDRDGRDLSFPPMNRDISIGGSAVQVSSGRGQTCALLDSGSIRCWGTFSLNGHGHYIGDNEPPAAAGDVPVGGTSTQLASGFHTNCVQLEAEVVSCWGEPGHGDDGDLVGSYVVGGFATQLTVGLFHICGLLNTGSLRCWGEGSLGQLGYGNTEFIGDDESPASVGDVPVGGSAMKVAAGGGHTCALLDTGAVRCWGWDEYGQLGYGNTENIGDDETPASIGDVPLGGTAVQIALGRAHTCALLDTGAVRCWGWGEYGQLGYGNTENIGDDETPASAGDVPIGGRAVRIAAGANQTCALLDSGMLRCWGRNQYRQLGYDHNQNIGDDETPASAGYVPYITGAWSQ